jgi:predicted nucleic acid-binding protein
MSIVVSDTSPIRAFHFLDQTALLQRLGAMLLVDEIDGRAAAAAAGVPFVGVPGVLARAKREGFIDQVRPLLDRLRSELRFRIAQKLYEQFLGALGE